MPLGYGYHVMPVNDLVAHEPEPGCVCGPSACPEPDRSNPTVVHYVFTHHSLDGRERNERAA